MKPLFFPSEELICGTVDIGPNGTTYCRFLLPMFCSPSPCLIWPTDTGFGSFLESIQALGQAYKPFLQTIKALEPKLQLWFPAISAHPDLFSIPSCFYLDETAANFPSLMDGTYLKVITDPQGFSPLVVDMWYCHLWCLHCNQVLTMTTGPGL
jgi:hypothetical protein